jgi:hypothetical protein
LPYTKAIRVPHPIPADIADLHHALTAEGDLIVALGMVLPMKLFGDMDSRRVEAIQREERDRALVRYAALQTLILTTCSEAEIVQS